MYVQRRQHHLDVSPSISTRRHIATDDVHLTVVTATHLPNDSHSRLTTAGVRTGAWCVFFKLLVLIYILILFCFIDTTTIKAPRKKEGPK